MRNMKDSGVKWLESIPETWNLLQLGSLFSEHKHKNIGMQSSNLLSLSYGKIIRKNINATDGLLPESFEGYNVIDAGDIVLRLTDLQNDQRSLRVGLCGERGIITSAYTTLRRRNDAISSKYFYYLLHSYDVRKGFYGMGAGVRQGLNYAGVRKIMLAVPSEREQTAIAECLDQKIAQVDVLISNVQAQIEKLKAYKQSLITEVVTKGLDPNAPTKDSGVEWIGKIPEDWEVVKTGRLFKENNRSPIGNDIPLSLSQMDGLVATDDMKESALKTSSYDNWKRVEIGDLVLNRFKAHLGVLFAANLTGIVSFHYGVYEAKRSLVPKFYEYLYHSNQYKAILGNASNGMVVGLQNLSNLGFYSTYSLYPPYDEQEKLVSHLDKKCSEIDELIALKQSKIEKLEQYKKSLIYEYVTGKKEVV